MLPPSIENESTLAQIYNNTLGTEMYQNNIRPYTDVILGGALRLFSENVYQGSYWSQNDETILHVAASLPYGSTLAQMDQLIRKMESYISTFAEVRQF